MSQTENMMDVISFCIMHCNPHADNGRAEKEGLTGPSIVITTNEHNWPSLELLYHLKSIEKVLKDHLWLCWMDLNANKRDEKKGERVAVGEVENVK